jgi:hypothetical protein
LGPVDRRWTDLLVSLLSALRGWERNVQKPTEQTARAPTCTFHLEQIPGVLSAGGGFWLLPLTTRREFFSGRRWVNLPFCLGSIRAFFPAVFGSDVITSARGAGATASTVFSLTENCDTTWQLARHGCKTVCSLTPRCNTQEQHC